MASVQRTSDRLRRNQAREERNQAREERTDNRPTLTSKGKSKKADGKPRSWKPVCDNERTVNIPQYTRTGTRNGTLAQVTIAAHCRNPRPRK